ncbi:uncharacterized protein DEA37_0009779 [Paragonimus westermani]|uniref:Reverse transcriptase RNase H-like domain-containing protein n=1 Tax=Paragonimus westermani TaxID=34504 RepID=A0A5J4NVQ7_9TREM|nr:uncharacterized protein DEA37_0009779 [Paragonimus westermani]
MTNLIPTIFHVETARKPVNWLKTTKDPPERLTRWAIRQQDFNSITRHVIGTNNEVPDALSRPIQKTELSTEAIPVNAVLVAGKELLVNQQQDPQVREICEHLLAGTKPKTSTSGLIELLNIGDRPHPMNGQLFVNVEIGDQVKVRDYDQSKTSGCGAGQIKRRWKGPLTITNLRNSSVQINQGPSGQWINAAHLALWHSCGMFIKGEANVVDYQTRSTCVLVKHKGSDMDRPLGTSSNQLRALLFSLSVARSVEATGAAGGSN